MLLKAVSKINLDLKDFEIVILGNTGGLKEIKRNYKYNFRTFDKNKPITDFELIKTAYSACDLLIMPSRLEALGQVALEAGSCSLPCVSFKNTGIEDIITHNEDGYLAEYLNVEDLARGIDLLNNESINKKLPENIRNKIIQEFSYEVISQK